MSGNRGVDSSLLVKPPVIAGWLFFCVLAVMFEKTAIGVFLGFVFVLTLTSYLWAREALKDVDFELGMDRRGLFPNQTFTVTRAVRNRKALPLLWAEIRESCEPGECAVPDKDVIVRAVVSRDESSEEVCAYERLYTLSFIGFHKTVRFRDSWTAKRRGIMELRDSFVRSGDGFGLCAIGKRFESRETKRIVVFPMLANVSVAGILNELWETRSASGGYLKDHTVIRQTRDYMPGDAAKSINQRLLARGQGLVVNVYETMTPDTILFVLDAAAFRDAAPEVFENALSVLAGLIDGLTRRGVRTCLAAPRSAWFEETCTTPSTGDRERFEMLALLAAASREDAFSSVSPPLPEDESARIYIVCPDVSHISFATSQALFPAHKTMALTALPSPAGVSAAVRGDGLRARLLSDFEN